MPVRFVASASRRPPVSLLLALLAAACGEAKKPERVRAPVAVLVAPVARADVPYVIEANGVVTPMASASITSQVDGIVERVSFKEGQEVAKGQELFAIDARPYQAAHSQARAALARDQAAWDLAHAQVIRYQEMAKTSVVTKEQFDGLKAQEASTAALLALDSAAITTAKFNLDNTVIHAPFSGRTGSVLVLPGNQVRSGSQVPLVVINQTHPIFVRFSVPASELRNVLRYGGKGGLPVTALPSGTAQAPAADSATRRRPQQDSTSKRQEVPTTRPTGGDAAHGLLAFVDNAVDTTTGTVMLKATFPNSDRLLWVGQFVTAQLQLYVQPQALVVPAQAVVTGQRGPYVYVIDDSVQDSLKVRQRPVTVERLAGPIAVIASGVHDGERVVTDGQLRLTPGAPVEIKTSVEGDGGGRRGKGGKGGKGGGGNGGGANGGSGNGGGPNGRPGRARPGGA